MSNPTPWKGSMLSLTILVLLVTAEAGAAPANFIYHSSPRHRLNLCYNSLIHTADTESLKNPDTSLGSRKKKDGPASGYIHRERNSDLVIEIPDGASGRYWLRFYDGQNLFLFEIKPIRDAYLVVEKYNFTHAGTFQYELYKDELVIERNSFLIKRE
jgi:hypothetical protein